VANAGDRFDPETVAQIIARLCHRFADREAILWRAGHDEESWSKLEERALDQMRDELNRGRFVIARAFVEEIVRARLDLVRPSHEPEGVSSAAPTIAQFARTLPAVFEAPSTDTNEDPFSITVTSATKDDRKPPRR